MHKTSHPSGDTSTSSKDIFSGGGDPVGSSTTEKWLMDGDSASRGVWILCKSSIVNLAVRVCLTPHYFCEGKLRRTHIAIPNQNNVFWPQSNSYKNMFSPLAYLWILFSRITNFITSLNLSQNYAILVWDGYVYWIIFLARRTNWLSFIEQDGGWGYLDQDFSIIYSPYGEYDPHSIFNFCLLSTPSTSSGSSTSTTYYLLFSLDANPHICYNQLDLVIK